MIKFELDGREYAALEPNRQRQLRRENIERLKAQKAAATAAPVTATSEWKPHPNSSAGSKLPENTAAIPPLSILDQEI